MGQAASTKRLDLAPTTQPSVFADCGARGASRASCLSLSLASLSLPRIGGALGTALERPPTRRRDGQILGQSDSQKAFPNTPP